MSTTLALAFDHAHRIDDPIRDDLVHGHRLAGERIARPGTWWTGHERVAIAAEARAADDCSLCRERREALSPNAVAGRHDEVCSDRLPAAAIDAIHRIVTDATRLGASWVAGLAELDIDAFASASDSVVSRFGSRVPRHERTCVRA